MSAERKWYGKELKTGKEYKNAMLDKSRLKPMEPGYQEEDVKREVRYLTPAEKKPFKVYKDGQGLFRRVDGERVPLADGMYMYAISPKGGLYVHNSDIDTGVAKGAIAWQHSSLLAGEPAQAAGYLDVRKGKIVKLEASSGHYKPSDTQLVETALGLLAVGLVDDEVELTGGGASNLQEKMLFNYSEDRSFVPSFKDA